MTASSPTSGSLRSAAGAGLIAWAAGAAPALARAWPFTIDDAYISARYAQQWAAGNGLVYNVGERVEGFSNFTWVCLLALLERGGVPLESGVKVLGLMAAAGAVLGMVALLYRRLGVTGIWPAAGAGLWLGLDPGFAVWAVAGLETPLFAALLVWSLYLWLDERASTWNTALLALTLSALAWTRPEGPAVAVGLAALTPLLPRDAAVRRARLTACAAALGCVAVGFLLRRWYYAAWWPNPYYVKLGGGLAQVQEGWWYWAAAVLRRGGPVLAVWVVLAAVVREEETHVRRSRRLLLLVLLGYSLFIIQSGREPFPFHRFAVPLVPLAIIVGFPAARALIARRPTLRPVMFTIGIVCAAVAQLSAGAHWAHVRILTRVTQDISLPFGRWVRETEELASSLGVFWAGAMPYAAGTHIRAVDMGGLCDRHIARVELPWAERNHGHTRHDFAYVLAQQPTYVTDDALHTLDTLIALGGDRTAAHARHRAQFLREYTRLNDHVFVRIADDTGERMRRYAEAFPEDGAARRFRAAYQATTN